MFGTGTVLQLECCSWVGKNSDGMYDYHLCSDSPEMIKSSVEVSEKKDILLRHKVSH